MNKSLNKEELVTLIQNRKFLTKKVINEVLNIAMDEIQKAVIKENRQVNLKKFGVFKPILRKAKKGYNMTTKKHINIPERLEFVFEASKKSRYFTKKRKDSK